MRLRILLLILATAACASARPSARPKSACDVLTRSDLAAVQGQEYAEAKLSGRGETSTCFFQLPSFVNSVSLDLTRGGGRDFWREHFLEREEEAEEEDEVKRPPKEVEGIGDAAFWAGSRMAGSLYVLKGDNVLRVSVGGAGTEEEKIAKSKNLAKRALKRL